VPLCLLTVMRLALCCRNQQDSEHVSAGPDVQPLQMFQSWGRDAITRGMDETKRVGRLARGAGGSGVAGEEEWSVAGPLR